MLKVTTKSGSVYEFYEDTKNWKRYKGEGANDIGFDTGVYEFIQGPVIGERMIFGSDTSNYYARGCNVYTTQVVSIEHL
jgi:hypothetical protein